MAPMDDAEANARTPRPRPGGVTGPGFRPGQSGNPGGRPRGIAAAVRARTRDGHEIVDLLCRVMRGEPVGEDAPTIQDRLAAVRELLQRG